MCVSVNACLSSEQSSLRNFELLYEYRIITGSPKGNSMYDRNIEDKDLETWSSYLLDHSLGGIVSSDIVMIKGERICWPLLSILERKVIEAGAIPDVCLVPPNNDRGRVWSATMGRYGSHVQMTRIPPWHQNRYEAMTKYIEVLGAEDPSYYTGLTNEQTRRLATAERPFFEIRLTKPGVLTLFPTPGFAALEGMDFEEYTRFIVRASTTDPRPLKQAEENIASCFEQAQKVTIETHCPDTGRDLRLALTLTECRPVLCYGIRNFPDGEIFTSPDARHADGEIFFDLPVSYGGHVIQGVYLKLERGRITAYHAEIGQEQLSAIIETDEGSHRLGEIALGMNPGLERVLKHPLYTEKVGGTLHIAIGASFEFSFHEQPSSAEGKRTIEALEKAGVFNHSAQHADFVVDFRPGGCGRRVFFGDAELIAREGSWRVRR
jgi:aminopeptidase